jgi:hypothetical protein
MAITVAELLAEPQLGLTLLAGSEGLSNRITWAHSREGMQVAKAKGRLRGNQPKLSRSQETHLISLYKGGQHTGAEIANCSSRTEHGVPHRQAPGRMTIDSL